MLFLHNELLVYILKCKCNRVTQYVKKKYFSHITDKSVPLRRNFLKALVIMTLFLLLILLLFLLIVFISLAVSLLSFSKWAFLHLYGITVYIKNWYFHSQYKIDGLGTNKISYISNLRHMSKVAAHFQNNNKMFISFIGYPNEESGKIFKN